MSGATTKRTRGRPALGADVERLSVSVDGATARRWRALAAQRRCSVADVIREATDARCDAAGIVRE